MQEHRQYDQNDCLAKRPPRSPAEGAVASVCVQRHPRHNQLAHVPVSAGRLVHKCSRRDLQLSVRDPPRPHVPDEGVGPDEKQF
ncbi:hypothetical protein EVAR_19041_1 [Eumeta japonica]|uniref:Uncharacterized protein n=1 Tax=Eumeta variegata TaxID=151549 RepID=A0A4C1V7X2_EUMVA|nr:hypothetical protein EVAR_19041_1 [Eumeta japonica]